MKKYIFIILLFQQVFWFSCSSQINYEDTNSQVNPINLKPEFAGQFYPADKKELYGLLKNLFEKSEPKKVIEPIAIITPHAGYIFSGSIAASAFNQINPDKKYENIFILGSSHREYFNGASIYSIGNCETPFGEVKVNLEIARRLICENQIFSYIPEAHFAEHTIEVQLPFLQYFLKNDFQIIPVIIGTQSIKDCKLLAEALIPYFNDKNLFIISSDFSHYPEYSIAIELDKLTAETILNNDPSQFIDIIQSPKNKKISGLATLSCGWSSVLTLLYLTENMKNVEYSLVAYSNSGDSHYGDKDRVVGYNAIAVSLLPDLNSHGALNLSFDEKNKLLEIARLTIENHLTYNKTELFDSESLSNGLMIQCGVFVTLYKNHRLRGCIGRFDACEPLYKLVQQMVIASATQDPRFNPVTKYELTEIEIEISLLSPKKLIKSTDEIILGKHGIYIRKGSKNGTFLPQVAAETGWTVEEFLGHCSRDKAGLGWDGWKEAEIYVYETIVLKESNRK